MMITYFHFGDSLNSDLSNYRLKILKRESQSQLFLKIIFPRLRIMGYLV